MAKLGFLYVLSSVLTQGINFFLVPVYTKNMTQEQFGQYNIITSLLTMLSIFATLGIYSGLSRFFFEYEDKVKLKNIALTFSLIWGAALSAIVYLLSPEIGNLIFNGDAYGSRYINYIVTTSVVMCFISIYTSYYSMQYKMLPYNLINVGKTFLMLVLSIYYIIFEQRGVIGALQAQLYSHIAVFLITLFFDLKELKAAFGKKELKDMLYFGLGLVPGNASAWVYTLIDRYFLREIVGLGSVALYSMGYRIGMLMLFVFQGPFQSLFTTYKFKVYKDAGSREKMRELYIYYSFLGWFFLLGISVFSKIAIQVLATEQYIEAFKIVPVIALSYFLHGLAEFYSLGIFIQNKSYVGSMILAVGAVSNIILNIFIIPPFGMYGAAAATVASYFVMNILYYIVGKRYYDMKISFFEPFKMGLVFLCLYSIYYFFTFGMYSMVLEISLNVILCLSYVLLCIIFDLIPKKAVINIIKSLKEKLIKKSTVEESV